MKSNNSDSIEVNPSPHDYKTPINNKGLNTHSSESNSNIKHCLFSRIIIHILIFSYFFGKLNFRSKFIFSNIPLFTIYKLEIHRLITNLFICESLYELIISIIMISTIINNFESKEGTILFFFKFFYNLIISQIFLLIIYYFLSFINPMSLVYRINSRELLCISYLVKHLLTTNTKKIINPFLGELNDRFIIVIFLLMYFFLNYEYRIDIIFCLYYGFIMCKYNNIFDIKFFPQKYINAIEMSYLGKILKISDYYISAKNTENNIGKNTLNNLNFNKYLSKKNVDLNDERMGLKAANDLENCDFMI